MSKLGPWISRGLVLILACRVGAHVVEAGQAAADANQAEKKPIPVAHLPLDANDDALKNAHDALLRHEIVAVEGATVNDMRRLLGLSLAEPKAPRENLVKRRKGADASIDDTAKNEVEGILRVIAVRTTPEGHFHVFYGFTSGIKPEETSGWTTGFTKWVNKESGIKEDTAIASDATVNAANTEQSPPPELGDAGPDPGAWTHLSTTTNSMTSGDQNTASVDGHGIPPQQYQFGKRLLHGLDGCSRQPELQRRLDCRGPGNRYTGANTRWNQRNAV